MGAGVSSTGVSSISTSMVGMSSAVSSSITGSAATAASSSALLRGGFDFGAEFSNLGLIAGQSLKLRQGCHGLLGHAMREIETNLFDGFGGFAGFSRIATGGGDLGFGFGRFAPRGRRSRRSASHPTRTRDRFQRFQQLPRLMLRRIHRQQRTRVRQQQAKPGQRGLFLLRALLPRRLLLP